MAIDLSEWSVPMGWHPVGAKMLIAAAIRQGLADVLLDKEKGYLW